MSDDLHKAMFFPDLLVAALNRHPDRPAVYLGDQVLTGREVAAQMSCYAQAYAAQGLTKGSPVAILSPNRPEVLFALGANMVTGCRARAGTRPGMFRAGPYSPAEREIRAAGQLACHRFPFPRVP